MHNFFQAVLVHLSRSIDLDVALYLRDSTRNFGIHIQIVTFDGLGIANVVTIVLS